MKLKNKNTFLLGNKNLVWLLKNHGCHRKKAYINK